MFILTHTIIICNTHVESHVGSSRRVTIKWIANLDNYSVNEIECQ